MDGESNELSESDSTVEQLSSGAGADSASTILRNSNSESQVNTWALTAAFHTALCCCNISLCNNEYFVFVQIT